MDTISCSCHKICTQWLKLISLNTPLNYLLNDQCFVNLLIGHLLHALNFHELVKSWRALKIVSSFFQLKLLIVRHKVSITNLNFNYAIHQAILWDSQFVLSFSISLNHIAHCLLIKNTIHLNEANGLSQMKWKKILLNIHCRQVGYFQPYRRTFLLISRSRRQTGSVPVPHTHVTVMCVILILLLFFFSTFWSFIEWQKKLSEKPWRILT